MLFSKYNMFKNHGEFVHLNMLKWALRHVPELGNKTVNVDETVQSMDVAKGGVDVTTVKDNVTNNKHVPYTDVKVNDKSESVYNVTTFTAPYGVPGQGGISVAKDVTLDDGRRFIANTGTDIIDNYASKHNGEIEAATAVSFDYDEDDDSGLKVDGNKAQYITSMSQYDYENGKLKHVITYPFQPYTAVVDSEFDSNNLASKMIVNHSGNTLTGISFPNWSRSYNVQSGTNISVGIEHGTEKANEIEIDTAPYGWDERENKPQWVTMGIRYKGKVYPNYNSVQIKTEGNTIKLDENHSVTQFQCDKIYLVMSPDKDNTVIGLKLRMAGQSGPLKDSNRNEIVLKLGAE